MKRMIAMVAGPLWRLATPVRRPLAMRLVERIDRRVEAGVDARMMPPILEALDTSGRRLERLEERLARVDRAASHVVEEVDQVFNGLSREVFRLQAQVEMLQRRLEAVEGAGEIGPVESLSQG